LNYLVVVLYLSLASLRTARRCDNLGFAVTVPPRPCRNKTIRVILPAQSQQVFGERSCTVSLGAILLILLIDVFQEAEAFIDFDSVRFTMPDSSWPDFPAQR